MPEKHSPAKAPPKPEAKPAAKAQPGPKAKTRAIGVGKPVNSFLAQNPKPKMKPSR